jgi:cell division septation protein DedD
MEKAARPVEERAYQPCEWFKVQICVSEDIETAERLARRLRQDGYNAYVVADDRA